MFIVVFYLQCSQAAPNNTKQQANINMIYLEIILWAFFIVYPIYIYMTHEQEKQSVIAEPSKRPAVYRNIMLNLWWPVLVLCGLVYGSDLSLSDIGLKWHWNLASQIGLASLVLLAGYLFRSTQQVRRDTEEHPEMQKQFAFVQWLMPTTKKEARYFIWGVSITAGICEELLFRGYLMHFLGQYLPTYGVVLVSSLAFGLPHIYQGPIHVLRTALLGLVMALIYLATDSIFIPIVLHALLDAYSGVLAYILFSNESPSPKGEHA